MAFANADKCRQSAVGSGGIAAGDEGVGALGLGVGHSPAKVAGDAASAGDVEGVGVAAEVVGAGLVPGAGPGGSAVGGGGDLRGQWGMRGRGAAQMVGAVLFWAQGPVAMQMAGAVTCVAVVVAVRGAMHPG